MGFWSNIVNTVVNTAKAVWTSAKAVAAKAVAWIADTGEKFIGKAKAFIKEKSVNKWIKNVLTVGQSSGHPWIVGLSTILLMIMDKFEDSEFAKKVDEAIDWVIKAAKNFRDRYLTPEENKSAEERDEVFTEAESELSGADLDKLRLARMINDYLLAKTAVRNLIENEKIENFEHYLRLRATQELLNMASKRFDKAKSIESIGSDEVFIVRIAKSLVAPIPEVKPEDMDRLNQLIHQAKGKDLIPYIFEQMINAWAFNLADQEQTWEKANDSLAKIVTEERGYRSKLMLGIHLTEEEVSKHEALKRSVAIETDKLDKLAKSINHNKIYVYAAEGFLKILEDSDELKNREYLIEEGALVGKLIIQCAEQGRQWEDLEQDHRDLLMDYANIFRKSSEKRASEQKQQFEMIEVGVSA